MLPMLLKVILATVRARSVTYCNHGEWFSVSLPRDGALNSTGGDYRQRSAMPNLAIDPRAELEWTCIGGAGDGGGTPMPEGQRAEPSAAVLASYLDSHRQEILDEYVRRLADRRSRLVVDQETRLQVVAQAADSLDEVIASLRSNDPVLDVRDRVLAKNIGVSRAARGVHPVESLQAATEFFAAFIYGMLGCFELDENAPLVQATLALDQSIMLRISEAASSYSSFLIDNIHRAHLDERQLLARNLHDRVGAGISVSYRQLELFSIYRENDPVAAGNRVESARQALAQVITDIRQLTADLRLVEPLHGLEKALREYVDAAGDTDVAAEIIVNGNETWASDQVRDEIFLVVREALRNALRHGAPRNVVALIDIAPHELRAAIEDDGRGFSAEKPDHSGSGIRSMQERVALLGGVFRLASIAGKGTQVEIQIPLEGTQSAHSG